MLIYESVKYCPNKSYCISINRSFKEKDYKFCPYCGAALEQRPEVITISYETESGIKEKMTLDDLVEIVKKGIKE